MVICSSCRVEFAENDCFCLNCGVLLKNYDNIKMTDEELSLNIDTYSSIIDEFNRELDKCSDTCQNYINLFNFNKITISEEIDGICSVFPKLTDVFNNYLKNCQDPAFNILAGFNYFRLNYPHTSSDEALDRIINSLKNFHESLKSTKQSVENLDISQSGSNCVKYKKDLLITFEKVITFHTSFLNHLNIIKSKKVEITCFECNFKIENNFKYCPNCGVKLSKQDKLSEIKNLQKEYNQKEEKIKSLINQFFNKDHESLNKFNNALKKFSEIFDREVFVAQNILEFNLKDNKTLDDAIKLLNSINDKLDQLVDEIIIKYFSSDGEVEKVFNDFESLINDLRKS